LFALRRVPCDRKPTRAVGCRAGARSVGFRSVSSYAGGPLETSLNAE
jgi:hypothetical protein